MYDNAVFICLNYIFKWDGLLFSVSCSKKFVDIFNKIECLAYIIFSFSVFITTLNTLSPFT